MAMVIIVVIRMPQTIYRVRGNERHVSYARISNDGVVADDDDDGEYDHENIDDNSSADHDKGYVKK